jgi:hypothetical protein
MAENLRLEDSQLILTNNAPDVVLKRMRYTFFFLCPFAKAAWFSSPWLLRSEVYFANRGSIPAVIEAILSSGIPMLLLLICIRSCGAFGSLEMIILLAGNQTNHFRYMQQPRQSFRALGLMMSSLLQKCMLP